MKKYAIIVAGGSGVRMGAAVPKQFLPVHGRAVLWYTLQTFLGAYEDLEIILVLPAEHLETGSALVDSIGAFDRVRMVTGGATRFHSVQNGCRVIAGVRPNEEGSGAGAKGSGSRGMDAEESVIFVHDGVRCLLSKGLVHRCHDQAMRLGSAIPVIDSRDSVRLVTGVEGREMERAGGESDVIGAGGKSKAIDRATIKLVQTPQTFLSHLLLPAYTADYQQAFTDDAMVVEAAGHAIHLIEGETNNIKITTPEDLIMAEYWLKGI
jgi:2-C-methyl-D-erythritol 4-phosphate cytidylyltransferase